MRARSRTDQMPRPLPLFREAPIRLHYSCFCLCLFRAPSLAARAFASARPPRSGTRMEAGGRRAVGVVACGDGQPDSRGRPSWGTDLVGGFVFTRIGGQGQGIRSMARDGTKHANVVGSGESHRRQPTETAGNCLAPNGWVTAGWLDGF